MIYLLLSIFASTLIFIVFKLFTIYNINTTQAIVFNYIFACTSGVLAYDKAIELPALPNQEWFIGALLLGLVFILIFNCMAITTQINGLSVAAVASKMSVAIPIVFGIIVYHETTGVYKITGIIVALFAVYFTSIKKSTGIRIQKENIIFPILVFIGSGFIDTTLKYMELHYVSKNDVPVFSATIFGSAAVLGIISLIYQAIRKKLRIEFKNIVGGIALGIPNYGSIYFLIQALRSQNLDSSTVFTINNVAILLVTTLTGIILFKEKLLVKNWIGIILAIVSILLVAFSI
ncbi:EamA family transporter [Aquimarina sp. W85]|uniref:EamA family transporter n=1 Tax=Aquimarina rhodophyticola TaxID=3342246 RepID=UPI00366EB12E